MKKRITIKNIVDSHKKDNEKIITSTKGYLGKDNVMAWVVICGVPFDDNSAFYKEISLIVITKDCSKKMELKAGYNPKASLLDFNGYGNEIYVTIDSGGSGGYQFFYVISYDKCNLTTLIDDEMYNIKFDKYTGCYLDYYKAQVVYGDKVWQIDLSCRGYDYLSQIYNDDGTLIEPKSIYIGGANYTYPQYNQSSKKHSLVVYQRITGLYSADSLGYMETILTFENSDYNVDSVYLKTQSNPQKDCVLL